MVCARNQHEVLKLLRGTVYETEMQYFRELFTLGGTEIELQVCRNRTVQGLWKVERNRMYGMPQRAEDHVPVQQVEPIRAVVEACHIIAKDLYVPPKFRKHSAT